MKALQKLTLKDGLEKHLQDLVFFLEIQGANPFKIRAFRNAIDIINPLGDEELIKRVNDGSLTEIQGIGKGILSVAQAFKKTSTSPEYKEALGSLPESLLELSEIRGLGPKKIKVLYDELGIKTLGELEYACSENRLISLKGFGAKTQDKLKAEIQSVKSNREKLLLPDALNEAFYIENGLHDIGIPVVATGQIARKSEIIERLDFLVDMPILKLSEKLDESNLKEIRPAPKENHVDAKSKGKSNIRIFAVQKSKHVLKAIELSSSADHWKALIAQAKKLKIDLEDLKLTSEQEFYETLKLPFHPSESRELAPTHSKSWSPIVESHLTGVFHLHTTASDGLHSLSQMAKAAKEKGWHYMGLSDHSHTAAYAGGLSSEALVHQAHEVETVEKEMGIKIFKGVESDILKDGALDYPASVLKKTDFVIASIHSRYGMKEMTERLIRAIENPYTNIIGHISGRLLLAREAYQFDAQKIIDAAIKNNRVIELNAHPQRLDMDWRLLHEGCQRGLHISINPDAHSTLGFDDVRYGVWMANKALIPRELILNTWPLEKVEKFLKSQRG